MKVFQNVRRKLSSNAPQTGDNHGNGGAHAGGNIGHDVTPRADVTFPRRERRKSSIARHAKIQQLKELQNLRDVSSQKREQLFQQKLLLCSIMFNFEDANSDKRGKDLKRNTLLELVDYVNSASGQKELFTEVLMPDIMACVSANICRALPPQTEDFDPEEDEPVLEPSWPHLQVVYEFLLRFVVSSEVNQKQAKKYVDQKFCLALVDLFDSEDPRERDYLKTILHRIYGKFMSHRSLIRKAISNVFYGFVFETERHNGIGELLEILGSIINGFAMPLKREHLHFLNRALIPLHKPKCVALYHQQLTYCIVQYVEKDPETAVHTIEGIVKAWPWSCSAKQVVFFNELEEILELIGPEQLQRVHVCLFGMIARCIKSQHFQVAERALYLWHNDQLVSTGCLSRHHATLILPLIYESLHKNSAEHWNNTVEGLAQNVLKLYMDYDMSLFDRCSTEFLRKKQQKEDDRKKLNAQWAKLGAMAKTGGG